jgi:hypothetical protein
MRSMTSGMDVCKRKIRKIDESWVGELEGRGRKKSPSEQQEINKIE